MFRKEFKKNLLKITIFPFVLQLLISTALLIQVFNQRRAALRVDEADLRISQIHHLSKLFIDLETGFRGYLLSHDEEFLEPYDHAFGSVESEIKFIKNDKNLSAKNGERIGAIEQLLQAWLRYSDSMRKNPDQLPKSRYRDSEGKRLMDSIRLNIQSILDSEEKTRAKLSGEWDTQLKITVAIVYSFAVLGALLIVAFLRNHIKKIIHTYETSSEEIRREREQYRALFDGIHDYGISLLDKEGKILSWSAGAERLTGFSSHEALDKNLTDFFPDDDITQSHLKNSLKLAFEEGSHEIEGWRLKKDGKKFWAESITTVLFTPQGELRGYSSIFRDYSKRRHYEEERAYLIKKLQEEVKSRDEFISMASHELRTPVTSMLLQIQNIEREVSKDEEVDEISVKRKALDLFFRQTTRLRKLIDGMIDVARIHTGHLPFNFEMHDLAGLLREVIDEHEEQFKKNGCPLEVTIENQIMAKVDAYRIEYVFSGLLNNAYRFGCKKKTLLSLRKEGENAVFEIQDFGPGIPQQYQEQIFERFGSTEGMNDQRGLGLGLYLSREIVDAHGGEITLRSNPGEGATFRVVLPLSLT